VSTALILLPIEILVVGITGPTLNEPTQLNDVIAAPAED
jgi:hypothetical protein